MKKRMYLSLCDQPLDRQINLADQHAVGEFVDHGAHLRHDFLHLGLVG